MGTCAEFMAAYRPSSAQGSDGRRLLETALGHVEPDARVVIATRLLDDGADPAGKDEDGMTTLHVLLGNNDHDFIAEAILLKRLLDGAADVNAVQRKFGTPLETLASIFKFSEAELTPFYDEILSRPDLDPLKMSVYRHTVLSNIRRWDRPVLAGRLEEYLLERGIDVPAP